MPQKITRQIEFEIWPVKELPPAYQKLVSQAREARKASYSPYSHFAVGAALLVSGHYITGANQENAAYPSGLCAERVALFSAGAQYPSQPLEALAVSLNPSARDWPKPCGACLQVMAEFEGKQSNPLRVLLIHPQREEVLWSEGVANLLPLAFNKSELGI